jgi:hypothetical protein
MRRTVAWSSTTRMLGELRTSGKVIGCKIKTRERALFLPKTLPIPGKTLETGGNPSQVGRPYLGDCYLDHGHLAAGAGKTSRAAIPNYY